ncbi:MAG: response regulator [Terriglobales bacterium]
MARKILLADDSVTAQNMGRKILADAGYDVVTVNNGSAALKRITEIKPDLIVLDVYMPGYSGLEVCQRLKDAEETAHIPVLLTVGKLEPFKPEEARRVRADGHIVKPFEASELLTAITRLEDRMVPQSEGSRFAASVSGVERFGGDGNGRNPESGAGADTGWKSRLGFPSKKKKEEKEEPEEDFTAAGTFREFRKGKGKGGTVEPFAVRPPSPPGQEPGLVPDIPRDITPEELDALSALAAKLDGTTPVVENAVALADTPVDKTPDNTTVGTVETPAVEVAAANSELNAADSDTKKETMKAEVESPAPAAEAKREGEIAAEIPVVQSETVSAVAAVETELADGQHLEVTAEVDAVTVNTALLAQVPAPVDRNDEPTFASAASSVTQVTVEKTEAKVAETVAVSKADAPKPEATNSDAAEPTPPVVVADAVATKEFQPEPLKIQDSHVEEPQAEKTTKPLSFAANEQQLTAEEERAPSDEELAQALRLLTPATVQSDAATIPSHGTLVAAGQLLAEEAARNASAGSRWIAEPVTLSREEAAISLEEEMFRTFAATHAALSAATLSREVLPGRITGVSAIAAAVENRLAAVEFAANAVVPSKQGGSDSDGHDSNNRGSSEETSAEGGAGKHDSQTVSAGPPAVGTPAEAKAEVSTAPNVLAEDRETEKPALEKLPSEKLETGEKDSPEKISAASPAEEVAPATFADAVGQHEVEATAEHKELVGETASTVVSRAAEGENQDSIPQVEDEEAMGKDEKARTGKSNWHQIRNAPASAPATRDVVEAAKEAEAPKAMAAAAADGSSQSSSSATDAGTIASIVDSVMADLRPRIVEEIVKKLAGK